MTEKKESLLKRCPGYITDRLVDVMRMFCIATRDESDAYSWRTSNIKTPNHLLAFDERWTRGAWQHSLQRMVGKLSDWDTLQKVGLSRTDVNRAVHLLPDTPDERPFRNARELADMTLRMVQELSSRRLGQVMQPPWQFLCFPLDLSDPTHRQKYIALRTEIVERQWRALLAAEQQVADHADSELKLLLELICWQRWVVPRLLLHLLELEHTSGSEDMSSDVQYVLEHLRFRFSDEKVSEDFHQHLRDLSRARRFKSIATKTGFSALIDSGVLQTRSDCTVVCDSRELAFENWRGAAPADGGCTFGMPARNWPCWLNDIMREKQWASPSVHGYLESLISYRRITQVYKDEPGLPAALVTDSWWSRCFLRYTVVTFRSGFSFLVLFAGRWGLTAMTLGKLDGRDDPIPRIDFGWKLNADKPVNLVYVKSDAMVGSEFDWPIVTDVEGFPDPTHGIALQPRSQSSPKPFMKHVLERRRDFTQWELIRILEHMQIPQKDWPGTKQAKLHRVIEIIYHADPPQLQHVKDLYSRAAEVTVDDEPLDVELISLLEEMAMSDQVNTGDFKVWQREARDTFSRRMGAKRDARRCRAARSKAAKKKRVKGRGKGGKGKGNGKGAGLWLPRRGRKRARAAAAAGDGGAEPAPARPRPPGSADGGAPGAGGGPPGGGGGPDPPGPGAAAPQRRHGVRPEATGTWEVFEVTGGWCRFNPVAEGRPGQLDAHCAFHNNCKSDRRLARQPFGLHLAWLAAAEAKVMSKDEHQDMKWELSQEAHYPRRLAAREDATDRAVLLDDLHPMKTALRQEAEVSGSQDEPLTVPCAVPKKFQLP